MTSIRLTASERERFTKLGAESVAVHTNSGGMTILIMREGKASGLAAASTDAAARAHLVACAYNSVLMDYIMDPTPHGRWVYEPDDLDVEGSVAVTVLRAKGNIEAARAAGRAAAFVLAKNRTPEEMSRQAEALADYALDRAVAHAKGKP